MELVRAPFPYVGNKHRHMELILENLPKDIDTFVEPFGGSAVVGLNAIKNKPSIFEYIYNDTCKPISQIIGRLRHQFPSSDLTAMTWAVNDIYSDSKEGFLELRARWNDGIDCDRWRAAALICIIARSFSNDIRFNQKGKINIPYGERNYLRLDEIKTANNLLGRMAHSVVSCKDFRDFLTWWKDPPIKQNNSYTFFFVDPPYLNSTFTQSGGWSTDEENELYAILSTLDKLGYKWMLTNTLHNRGVHNTIFQKFIDTNNFRVIDMKGNYGNSSFRKSKKPTTELMVMNY